MKQYRIVKEHWRNENDQTIEFHFAVQQLSRGLFSSKTKWVPCTRTHHSFGDMYTERVVFRSIEQAKDYVGNALTELPEDEVVCVSKVFEGS